MWGTEQAVETTVEANAFWRAWSEVERWSEWNADVTGAQLTGQFAADSIIEMTMADGSTVQLRLAEVEPGRSFTDQAEIAETIIRTRHRIEELESGGRRVVYRLEAEGPQETVLGPAISSDFGDVLKELVAYAGGR
jgi:Polyketide cyclase / dehydrase and lipid transport